MCLYAFELLFDSQYLSCLRALFFYSVETKPVSLEAPRVVVPNNSHLVAVLHVVMVSDAYTGSFAFRQPVGVPCATFVHHTMGKRMAKVDTVD